MNIDTDFTQTQGQAIEYLFDKTTTEVLFGGAAGETMVADVEKIGTLGDAFETDFGLIQQLDRQEKEDPSGGS